MFRNSFVIRNSEKGYTLETIIRSIRGTRQYDWRDGILETSRQGARMLGRTLINGASNAARLEMFEVNRDVIDGVKFLGTFDSRTCLVCATYDGKIWPSDQLEKVVRPPLHPNCRCIVKSHIDLGEEFAGTRPVENEDFEKMAKDAHEANQKATKPWEELTYDYRKQLRYKAMKDWSNANGDASPYRHVSGDKTFKEIFETQPESFQKSWLGTTRYEYFKAGKLTLDQIVSPDTGYVKTLEDLEKDGIIPKRRRKK